MNSRYYGYDLAVISSKGIQRSPCRCCYELHDLFLMPLQFANHRLIARDGHNIMADQMKDALKHISVSISVRLGLSSPPILFMMKLGIVAFITQDR
jgi:hypothetical protein